jgi:hypothetical protein
MSLSYQDGYEDGWDRRAAKVRRLSARARQFKNKTYKIGFDAGWHDGEGRGCSWKVFNALKPGMGAPKPASWGQYEKDADKVAL